MGVQIFDEAQVARWSNELTTGAHRWWVAERGECIVGFVGVGPSRDPIEPGLGELDTIAVAPDGWRTGVGRALMSTALRALADDFDAAILWTVAGYERGHRFYETTGWTANGRTRADGNQVSFRRDAF